MKTHLTIEEIQKEVDWLLEYLGKYEQDNPGWLEAEISRFFEGACQNLYNSQSWDGRSNRATFVKEEFAVNVGQPGGKNLYCYSVLGVKQTCCKEHLSKELSDMFFRIKTHKAIEAIVGPAALEVNRSHATSVLPVDCLNFFDKLAKDARRVLCSFLTRPKKIVLRGILEKVPQEYVGRVRLAMTIRISPLVVNWNFNSVYYPIEVSARLFAPKDLRKINGLLGSGLTEMIEAIQARTPEEIFPQGKRSRRGRWVKQETEQPFEPNEYTHSEDFRNWSILRPGTLPTQEQLTVTQAMICKVLWDKLATKNPYMYYDDILKEIGIKATSASRLHDQLRSRWSFLKRLLRRDDRGNYRLNVIRTL